MNLVTFNILNNKLATKDIFYYLENEFLSFEFRQKNIKKQLKELISTDAVICLQEVGQTWNSILLPFFHGHNYFYVSEGYGSLFNDYMGIAIAFPIGRYQIMEYQASRIADNIYADLKESIRNEIENEKYQTKNMDILETITRDNIAQFIKLIDISSKKISTICNYHMPCRYRNPNLMALHAFYYIKFGIETNSKKRKKKEEGNDIIYFCGDFNIIPNTETYKLLTDDNSQEAYDLNNKLSKIINKSISNLGLKSLYKLYNGKEPDFTNYVLKKSLDDGEEVFKETLDYIFLYHPNFDKNEKLKGQVITNQISNPIPDKIHSSDHLYIFAKDIIFP